MRRNGSLRFVGVHWPSVLLVLLGALVALPALAGQRIEFKNGQVLVVQRVRYDGEIAYLTLADGSEIGFPKALIKTTRTGFKVQHRPFETSFSGRGPSANQLRGYKHLLGEAGYPPKLIGKGILSGKHKKPISVGFRYKGSVDISELARQPAKPVPIWDATRTAGGGQVTPAPGATAAAGRPVRRQPPTSLGMPRQVEPRKGTADGVDLDPKARWK